MALIDDPAVASAVSNITPRSERQPDPKILRETYVETGVLPQLANFGNQVLYGLFVPAVGVGGTRRVAVMR